MPVTPDPVVSEATGPPPRADAPHVGGKSPAGPSFSPDKTPREILRIANLPVIPFVFPLKRESEYVLDGPKTIEAIDRLGEINPKVRTVNELGHPTVRITLVWLSDRFRMVKAGLVDVDEAGVWRAEVYWGTVENAPPNVS